MSCVTVACHLEYCILKLHTYVRMVSQSEAKYLFHTCMAMLKYCIVVSFGLLGFWALTYGQLAF